MDDRGKRQEKSREWKIEQSHPSVLSWSFIPVYGYSLYSLQHYSSTLSHSL